MWQLLSNATILQLVCDITRFLRDAIRVHYRIFKFMWHLCSCTSSLVCHLLLLYVHKYIYTLVYTHLNRLLCILDLCFPSCWTSGFFVMFHGVADWLNTTSLHFIWQVWLLLSVLLFFIFLFSLHQPNELFRIFSFSKVLPCVFIYMKPADNEINISCMLFVNNFQI